MRHPFKHGREEDTDSEVVSFQVFVCRTVRLCIVLLEFARTGYSGEQCRTEGNTAEHEYNLISFHNRTVRDC